MPEVITIALEGKDIGLDAQLKKAIGGLQAFGQKAETAGASYKKALSTTNLANIENEIKALKLEVDGYTHLATTLRETNKLKEQASRLAASANITEEKALAILREKAALERNVAAKLSASGTIGSGAEIQRRQDAAVAALAEEAGRRAAAVRADMRAAAESQSASILASSAAARKAESARAARIADPRSTGLPGLQLTPATLQSMESGAFLAQNLKRQTDAAGMAGKNGALGFLAFSQAVEDAQYGVKGVLNNIPQMVLGFGGSAGVAGALSLAAVAAVAAYSAWEKFSGAKEAAAAKKMAEEVDAIAVAAIKAATAFGEAENAERAAIALAAEYNEIYRQRLGLHGQMDGYYDGQLAAMREERDLAAEIARARESQVSGAGGDSKPLVAARQQTEIKGIQQDLANRRKELEQIQQQAMASVQKRDNIAAEAAAREVSETEKLVSLKQELARQQEALTTAENNQKFYQENKDSPTWKALKDVAAPFGGILGIVTRKAGQGIDRSDATLNRQEIANAKIHKEKIDELTASIAELEKTRAAGNPAATQALKALDESITAADLKINKTNDEVKALERLKIQREELNQIERQSIALEEKKKNLSALHEEEPKIRAAIDLAEKQRAATQSFTDSMQLMRTAAAPGADATKLMKDAARDAEAQKIAADTGGAVDANEAVKYLTEAEAHQKKIARDLTQQSGSLRERAAARDAQHIEDRQAKRDERVKAAALDREARKESRRQLDEERRSLGHKKPGGDKKDNLDFDRDRREAKAAVDKANSNMGANIKAQLEIQKEIKDFLTTKLAAA